jgi:hypothetical protein
MVGRGRAPLVSRPAMKCGGRGVPPVEMGFAPSPESHSEFIKPVERGHLISLRQRRIVKHRVAE